MIKILDFNDWYLENDLTVGYEGENLVNEIRLLSNSIDENTNYRIETDEDIFELEKHIEEGYLSLIFKASMKIDKIFKVQVVGVKEEVDDNGVTHIKTKKSNVATWRYIDSLNISKKLEEEYPDILDTIFSAYQRGSVEMKYEIETQTVYWKYRKDDEWYPLFRQASIVEGASAFAIARRHGFMGDEEEWVASLKGEKGDDGYTPIKGVDYFDGKNGKDGYTPVKNIDYFDGANGRDGVSIVAVNKVNDNLIITLSTGRDVNVGYVKGDKGSKGDKGDTGENGQDGYSPVKGLDYFTEEDKTELTEDIVSGNKLIETSETPSEGKVWFNSNDTGEEINIYTAEEVNDLLNQSNQKINETSNKVTTIVDNLKTINEDIGLLNKNIEEVREAAEKSVDIYSETETVIGKWIDGRDVYRKVITLDSPAINTGITVNHGITNLEAFIGYGGYCLRADGLNQVIPNAYVGNSDWRISLYDYTATNFVFRINASSKTYSKAVIILEYIKTA